MFKHYFQLVKPGVTLGNLISVMGGFLLASKGNIDYILLMYTLISMSLIISSSCIFNNCIDIDIDKKMERTKNRVLVKGLISPTTILVYAGLLNIIGFSLLWFGTNLISFCLGIIGFIIYVFVYSLYIKRYSIYSTIIGSISGAIPPIVGYCSVTSKFDICAFILLTIFILWQIPHSYSIVILHLKDYQLANIPVLPVVKGISDAKKHITIYIISFIIATLILPISGYTGYRYLLVTIITNLWWLGIDLYGYVTTDDKIWARKMVLFSIISIILISLMISMDFKSLDYSSLKNYFLAKSFAY